MTCWTREPPCRVAERIEWMKSDEYALTPEEVQEVEERVMKFHWRNLLDIQFSYLVDQHLLRFVMMTRYSVC